MTPKYTIWDAIQTALGLATRALREVRTLARMPGPPGKDGFGFDDLMVEQISDRAFAVKFARADRSKEFQVKFPVMIYRGVYEDGRAYETGDTVTSGGSMFVANADTSDRPERTSAWTLAVKRGRDGKAGKDGTPGEAGKQGPPGRDGRAF